MSNERTGRSARTVALADHLWEALEQMAREMGADRDTLVNQAIFNFARLNGYVTPGRVAAINDRTTAELPADRSLSLANDTGSVTDPELSASRLSLGPTHASASAPGPRTTTNLEVLAQAAQDEEENLPEELEAPPEEPPEPLEADDADSPEEESEAPLEDDDEWRQLEGHTSPRSGNHLLEEEPAPEPEYALYVIPAAGRPVQVTGDRFLIGRGKHCDLVIDSNRVSREHAQIVRDGEDLVIEDLKSSNGTWHNKQKVGRRVIEDGDEYLLGTERVTCAFRPAAR